MIPARAVPEKNTRSAAAPNPELVGLGVDARIVYRLSVS